MLSGQELPPSVAFLQMRRFAVTLSLVAGLLLGAADGAGGQEWPFVTVAEGWTSSSQKQGIRVAFRMWALPDAEIVCATAPRPSKLVPGSAVVLKVGERFFLNRLAVVARDEAGRLLRKVPIVVEVEEPQPPLLLLRSDAIADSRLHVLRRGSFRFRVRTTCEGVSVSTLIPATIK